MNSPDKLSIDSQGKVFDNIIIEERDSKHLTNTQVWEYTKWTEGVNPVHFLPKTPNPIGFDQKTYPHLFF